MQNQVGWEMAGWNSVTRDARRSAADRLAEQKWWFWRLTAVMLLDTTSSFRDSIHLMENENFTITLTRSTRNYYTIGRRTVEWNPDLHRVFPSGTREGQATAQWNNIHPLVALAHELTHAAEARHGYYSEVDAVIMENRIRWTLYQIDNSQRNLYPRPGINSEYWRHHDAGATTANPRPTAAEAWAAYNQNKNSIGN